MKYKLRVLTWENINMKNLVVEQYVSGNSVLAKTEQYMNNYKNPMCILCICLYMYTE